MNPHSDKTLMPTPAPTSAARPRLSVCMIVKDERATLARCLQSVKSIADEIVVVDTGSTDGSQAIAREHGARLIQSTWENDFSRARNQSLAAATGAWVLVLDADEYLRPEDGNALRELIAKYSDADGRATTAFQLILENLSADGRPGMLAYITRLFPNRNDVRFEWPIHEQVMTSLLRAGVPVQTSTIKFLHTGYADRERNRAKQQRNREILQAQVAQGVDVTPMTYFLLGGCHLDLGEHEEALKRYRTARQIALSDPHGAELARGAQVRIVTCLISLGRAEEAFSEMPAQFDSGWHPELIVLRADAAAKLGRADEARSWHERVLECGASPQIPPYDAIQLKCDSLHFLGAYWRERGKPALGVRLLRSALALKQEGVAFGPAELEALYKQYS
jgi:Glycosyl transferase family 2